MPIIIQTHGGDHVPARKGPQDGDARIAGLAPEPGDTAADERADFGYLFPPSEDPAYYLPADALDELDQLGERMIPDNPNPDIGQENQHADIRATPDSSLPPVMTYWGQFLDHELTARTDRDTDFSKIECNTEPLTAKAIEKGLKNARTPRFDLDSVYGGLPIGEGLSEADARDTATIISAMRHPEFIHKMRVGTAHNVGHLPDGLDSHRDLPRFSQVAPAVREAYLRLVKDRLPQQDFDKMAAGLPQRAIIGDMRNDENLLVAQFHLSVLRFHNKAVDYLTDNPTGWIPDFQSAKKLTTLHYQWLLAEVFLKAICDPAVVGRILLDKAEHFFDFRKAYLKRNQEGNQVKGLGNALPLEFSVAAYRFGHTMVRNAYDFNRNFGRPGDKHPDAKFERLFRYTGDGKFDGHPRLTREMVIDWKRYVTADPSNADGFPARVARKLDTELAPPLSTMINAGQDPGLTNEFRKILKHLARRNLRRGFSLRLPTGQALHAHLKTIGAVQSGPIADIGTALNNKPDLANFLRTSKARLHERTPLWFYFLAEAEAAGGNHLGELGSWVVASCFIGTLLSDPESALSIGFEPAQSPLRAPDGTPIDSIEKWMKFAHVLE